MANELRLAYANTGATITCKAFYDVTGTMTDRTPTISLDEDVAGIYGGDADAGWEAGDTLVYYDGTTIVASETYLDSKDACDTALSDINLDHLMKVPTSDRDTLPEVVDDTVLANILTKTDGDTSDFDHSTDSLEAIKDSQSSAGSGAITFTYTLYTDEDAETGPIADVAVWVTTDSGGSNVVASGTTNVSGAVVFYLSAGTYYFWRQKSGYNFTNPDTETVS